MITSPRLTRYVALGDRCRDFKTLVELVQDLSAMTFDDLESCERFEERAPYFFDRLAQYVDELYHVVHRHGIGYGPLALRALQLAAGTA